MTFTVLEWLPVFTRPDTVRILPEAFAYRQQNQGVRLYGYVIPENHPHCIFFSRRIRNSGHMPDALCSTEPPRSHAARGNKLMKIAGDW